MTPSEAAKVLHVTTHQVRHLIRNGQLQAKRVPTTANQHGYAYELDPKQVRQFRRRGRGRPKMNGAK